MTRYELIARAPNGAEIVVGYLEPREAGEPWAVCFEIPDAADLQQALDSTENEAVQKASFWNENVRRIRASRAAKRNGGR